MVELIIAGSAAAVVGLFIGAFGGMWFADKRLRSRIEEIGNEVARLRSVAEEKLTGDDPDLATLLKNLHAASENAYRAVDALEHQAELTRRKSAGGREVIASSRYILRMMQELGADIPDIAPAVAATVRDAPTAKAPSVKSAPVIEAKAVPTTR